MQLRLLLDEDTKSALARHLSKSAHETERVVGVDSLGPGSTDREVMEYARSTNRIIVTHDDDFANTNLRDKHQGVFYCPNQRLPPFEVYRIINEVVASYPNRESFPAVVYLTQEWL
jgi:predicted nuclease of predicted toxin-antitoxin system